MKISVNCAVRVRDSAGSGARRIRAASAAGSLLGIAVGALVLGSLAPLRVHAQATATLSTLYTFSGGSDGADPETGLTLASDGNFYGTTKKGGNAANDGTVFRLTPDGVLTTIYTFSGGSDGAQSTGGLLQAAGTNLLYGTTTAGGQGHGVIFSISLAGTFATVYQFADNGDGQGPDSNLVQTSDGTFYGTTTNGGAASNDGTVFSVSAAGSLTTLHTFDALTGLPGVTATDGAEPHAGLVLGSDGNLYGTTQQGGIGGLGTGGLGTIFKITPAGVLTTLWSFRDTDGSMPNANLLLGTDGNFYGTTQEGGATYVSGDIQHPGDGTVFKVTPAGALTILHSFTNTPEGSLPSAAVIQAADGNFYGTTTNGGANHYGTVFQVTPTGACTTLHSFANGSDGAFPDSALVQGTDGNLYGTTAGDGVNDHGTVFKLVVTPLPAFFDGQMAVGNGVYYLPFPNGNYFGYYSFLSDANYIYHFDLGYEYVFDAADGMGGVYLYDFASGDFFYTSPVFPFPYLYDFTLQAVLYYFANNTEAGRYTTDPRYFYNTSTKQIITH
jgi:uncharacterized repeat protein (TIGR03803 family)